MEKLNQSTLRTMIRQILNQQISGKLQIKTHQQYLDKMKNKQQFLSQLTNICNQHNINIMITHSQFNHLIMRFERRPDNGIAMQVDKLIEDSGCYIMRKFMSGSAYIIHWTVLKNLRDLYKFNDSDGKN